MNQSLPTATYRCRCKTQSDIAQQESELKAHAQKLNLTIIANYSDNVFAYKLEGRLQFDELIKAAIRKEFDCVLIYKFTSFAAGVPHLLHVLKQFIQLDIRLISLHDKIDTQGQMGPDIIKALQMIIELKEALLQVDNKKHVEVVVSFRIF